MMLDAENPTVKGSSFTQTSGESKKLSPNLGPRTTKGCFTGTPVRDLDPAVNPIVPLKATLLQKPIVPFSDL